MCCNWSWYMHVVISNDDLQLCESWYILVYLRHCLKPRVRVSITSSLLLMVALSNKAELMGGEFLLHAYCICFKTLIFLIGWLLDLPIHNFKFFNDSVRCYVLHNQWDKHMIKVLYYYGGIASRNKQCTCIFMILHLIFFIIQHS